MQPTFLRQRVDLGLAVDDSEDVHGGSAALGNGDPAWCRLAQTDGSYHGSEKDDNDSAGRDFVVADERAAVPVAQCISAAGMNLSNKS